MPQIAEMKEIDGDLWVRIPRNAFKENDGAITIFSDEEIRRIKFNAVQGAVRALSEWADNQ